jgi:ASC-1-like (ASCH) protein
MEKQKNMNNNTEIKKSVQLTVEPLNTLLENGESLDFRLDQEYWRDLVPGDLIEFWEDFTGWEIEPSENARKVVVRIKHIYRAPSFKELFSIITEDLARLEDTDKLLKFLRSWWSEEKEIQEGVLAFHVVVEK